MEVYYKMTKHTLTVVCKMEMDTIFKGLRNNNKNGIY